MILTATINEVKRRILFDNPQAVVAVKGDYEVNGIAFAFPAIYEDDFDLSTAVKTVYYKATDGVIYNHVVTATDTDTGYPLWVFKDEINKGAFGDVEFALVCDKVEGGNIVKRWVSMITAFRVQKSIEIDESEQEDNEQTYSERLAYLMTQMANMQATVSSLASGAPTAVSLASGMTDTNKLYVYTGSESGYTAGHWYYYNGSAWADGGQYGGTSVDTTLTVSGAAADAKVTGDKISEIKEDLNGKVSIQQDASDAGKLLGIGSDGNIVPQSVQTEIADNSITYDKLHKTVVTVPQSKVDFWYYNGEKRTDGTAIEVVPELDMPVQFTYPNGTNTYRIYYISDDGTVKDYGTFANEYASGYSVTDGTNVTYRIVVRKAGKFYIPLTFGTQKYFSEDTKVVPIDAPYHTDFLQSGWEAKIMGITAKYPKRVTSVANYSTAGASQGFRNQIPTYSIPHVGWYKTAQYYSLLDEDWNWVKSSQSYYFYNDGSYAYVQGPGTDKDVAPEYIGDGISAFGDMQVISKHDQLDINKPFGHAIVCFGDSITSTGYPSKLAELGKCLALNYGKSGNRSGQIRKIVTGIGLETGEAFDWSSNPVDTCIIMAGYNDTYQGTVADDIPSTTIADASNDWTAYLALFNASHTEQGTTCGNLGFMIEWLQANKPNVRILIANYHNNNDANGPTRTIRCDEAAQAVSELYGVQLLDVRRTSGINKKNAATYTTDGFHPNDAGQVMIAKAILRQM